MIKVINILGESKLHLINRGIKQSLFAVKVDYGSKYDNMSIGNNFLPVGTAHFLEHAIFYKREGHIGDSYFNIGAYANAITSYDSTIYYTTINNNPLESVKLLLKTVLEKPSLSITNLDTEREVIKNEILQKQNNHLYKVSKQLISSMYEDETIVNDVTGKEIDVDKIGIDELLLSYASFYNPKNLTFYLMGDLPKLDTYSVEKLLNEKIMKATKDNKYLNSEICIKKRQDNYINSREPIIENSEDTILLGFKINKKGIKIYEGDFYGKLTGRILVNMIQMKYPSLEIKEHSVNIGSDYSYIASIWKNNCKDKPYDFSFLFDLESEKNFIDKNIEIEVNNIKRKLEILFDSVDLFFISYIEKNYFDETIYNYADIIIQFDYKKFWAYYKQFIKKNQFTYVTESFER